MPQINTRKNPTVRIITVADQSMAPVFPQGTRLTCVVSEKMPEHEDYTVLIRGQQILIRQFLKQADHTILLKAFGKGFDTYSIREESLSAAGELLLVLHAEYDLPSQKRLNIPLPDPRPAVKIIPEHPENAEAQDLTYFTLEEAQTLLKVRRTKMYALLRSGELEASKVGKLWRIRRSAIADYLSRKTFRK